jgi:hypothetical protein
MADIIKFNTEYKQWLADPKKRIRQSQLKAAVKVNSELIGLYWSMGKDIVEKQENSKYGDGLIKQLSQDMLNTHIGLNIGLMICKSKGRYIAEYALKDINQPIGVSGYERTKCFPKDFKGSLPTIEEIEAELE